MSLPHVHGTSTASVASADFKSASEGSTAGTLEASWGVRTKCSYVGSQDEVEDPKNQKPKNGVNLFYQSTNAIQRALLLRYANALLQEFWIANTSFFGDVNTSRTGTSSCKSRIQVWLRHDES